MSCSLILELPLPPLSSVSFHFMHFKALLLGTDAFRTAMLFWCICCRKGDPFQGPKLGSCLTLGNELSEETHADKARDFIGKGHPGGEQEGQGTQRICSASWRVVSGFMVMGLVSGWSLANHPNLESFLVAHASLNQDGCKERDSGKWTDMQCLLLTFPQLFRLVVAY